MNYILAGLELEAPTSHSLSWIHKHPLTVNTYSFYHFILFSQGLS